MRPYAPSRPASLALAAASMASSCPTVNEMAGSGALGGRPGPSSGMRAGPYPSKSKLSSTFDTAAPAGGVEPPEGDGFCRDAGQGGRFRARFRLPCASSRRPFPARAAGPPEGDGRRRGTPQGGFSERRPRLPCGGLQQICRSPQGFTRRPRPALPRYPSVFPRA